MDTLQNAIDSIALGMEDYNSTDSRRLISSTRNIFTGILLLFKCKLVELSPLGSDEVLIKQRIKPIINSSGNLEWQGDGSKTVDVQQIRERFEGLKISVDWKKIEKINRYRNDIEHYYSTLTQDAIRVLISDSFIIIRDFIRIHLDEDPLDLLGAETWNALTNVAEVYKKEKEECLQHIKAVDWKYDVLKNALLEFEFQCAECGSGLIDVSCESSDYKSAVFNCRSCGVILEFDDIVESAINDQLFGDNYIAETDGGEVANITCPVCSRDTYLLDEDICIICEERVERTCRGCSSRIPAAEIDGSGYCPWCAHIMSKDD